MNIDKVKGVLFDLDGTLVDSIELIVTCFQTTFKEVLNQNITREEVLSYIGKPLRPQLELLAPNKGQQLIEKYREIQFKLHDSMVKPYKGVYEAILSFKDSGYYLGIVTSKGKDGTNAALNLFGPKFRECFTVIISADDSSTHKPEPGPLLQAANFLKIEHKNCVYIGDTIFDMQAAIRANMLPIGLTWGVASRDDLTQYTKFVWDSLPNAPLFQELLQESF